MLKRNDRNMRKNRAKTSTWIHKTDFYSKNQNNFKLFTTQVSCFPSLSTFQSLSLSLLQQKKREKKSSISRTQRTHHQINFQKNRSNHFRMKSISRWKIGRSKAIAATVERWINKLFFSLQLSILCWKVLIACVSEEKERKKKHFGGNNNNEKCFGKTWYSCWRFKQSRDRVFALNFSFLLHFESTKYV